MVIHPRLADILNGADCADRALADHLRLLLDRCPSSELSNIIKDAVDAFQAGGTRRDTLDPACTIIQAYLL